MFWVGLLITAGDVLAALAGQQRCLKSAVRHEELSQRGVLVLAQITGILGHLLVRQQPAR